MLILHIPNGIMHVSNNKCKYSMIGFMFGGYDRSIFTILNFYFPISVFWCISIYLRAYFLLISGFQFSNSFLQMPQFHIWGHTYFLCILIASLLGIHSYAIWILVIRLSSTVQYQAYFTKSFGWLYTAIIRMYHIFYPWTRSI